MLVNAELLCNHPATLHNPAALADSVVTRVCWPSVDPLHLTDPGPSGGVPAERRDKEQPLLQQRARRQLPPVETQSG